jgi:hypothetical protein
MHIFSDIQSLDRKLNATLHQSGADASVFAWYLAVQLETLDQYHAEYDLEIEDKLPYPSMSLPSAPTASFYVEDKHFQQYAMQSAALQECKDPNLLIQLYNSLQPQSLHWQKELHQIPADVIENSSVFAQQKLKPSLMTTNDTDKSLYDDERPSPHVFDQADYKVQSAHDLPRDTFVESTFETLEHALSFQL